MDVCEASPDMAATINSETHCQRDQNHVWYELVLHASLHINPYTHMS